MQDFQSFHFTLFCAHYLGLNFHYGKYAKMPGSEGTKVPWKCYEDVVFYDEVPGGYAPKGGDDAVMKAVVVYDAEILGGCVLEGCGGAVMKAVAFYDAEFPEGCALEG